ncbi:MAG: nucleotide exchange factor GrpE, partial [Rhodoferax sp.]|nr:nucleotide exchange factor GrpE [Rhodoferax sp.]
MTENTPSQDTAEAAATAANPEAAPKETAKETQIDLAAQLAELQAKNAELADLYLRAQADVQNARRRADDEIAKTRKFAVEGFAEGLLPVIDSLEAGLAIPNATIEQIREGSEATLRQLKSALERHKVLEVNPAAGTKFDPTQHQAISM